MDNNSTINTDIDLPILEDGDQKNPFINNESTEAPPKIAAQIPEKPKSGESGTDSSSEDSESLFVDSSDSSEIKKIKKPSKGLDLNHVLKYNYNQQKEDASPKTRNENIAEEVELMDMAYEDPQELYRLLITDPEYYLNIIETYRKENLSDKFNCKVSRNDGKMLVKFKIFPEEKWTEVGYFSNNYDDKETCDEFIEHVKVQLNKPRKARPKPGQKLSVDEILGQSDNRDHLDYELGEHNDITNENFKVNNKVKKENPRNDEPADDPDELMNKLRAERAEGISKIHLLPKVGISENNLQKQKSKAKSKSKSRQANGESDPLLDTGSDALLQAYLNQILGKIASNIPKWFEFDAIKLNTRSKKNKQLIEKLESNYNKCPMYLRQEYLHFMNSLSCPLNQEFVDILTDISEEVSDELKPQFASFINKAATMSGSSRLAQGGQIYRHLFAPDFEHDQICEKLNMSQADKDLLQKYNVDLLTLWNSYVNTIF